MIKQGRKPLFFCAHSLVYGWAITTDQQGLGGVALLFGEGGMSKRTALSGWVMAVGVVGLSGLSHKLV